MIADSNGDRGGDTRPLWITGLSPPDSWRSLRQPGYLQLDQVRTPKHCVWGYDRTLKVRNFQATKVGNFQSQLTGFIVLHHERRRIVHFGVTANPTMAWVAQQIREAFPWGTAPRHLIRDRDGAYGQSFRSTVTAMGVEEVVTAPRSPWQNPYVERLIGSVRRECLDHSIILNERHLRRILGSYLDYYHGSRTHLSLGKDTPDGRPVQPAGSGTVVSLPKVGGLHHRYERLAA